MNVSVLGNKISNQMAFLLRKNSTCTGVVQPCFFLETPVAISISIEFMFSMQTDPGSDFIIICENLVINLTTSDQGHK